MRTETRLERYHKKMETAVRLPVSLATINFMFDDNLAFLIRSAACFGIPNIYVIGNIPPRKVLYPKSGSTYDLVNLRNFSNPRQFLEFAQQENLLLIAAEIEEGAENLYQYRFDFSRQTAIILGHEMSGIPVELMLHSKKVFIPMPGVGYSLNVSQCGTTFCSEVARQYGGWI